MVSFWYGNAFYISISGEVIVVVGVISKENKTMWQDQRQFMDISKYIGHYCVLSVVTSEAVSLIKPATKSI